MTDIKTIIKAWATSFNPSGEQLTLAEQRLDTCNNCDKVKHVGGFSWCGKCLCPISKKIFSDKPTCPLDKWEK